MTAEPSPRPWRLEGKCIFTAAGDFIGEMEHTDDARFVVAAANKHGMPIVELIKAYDSLEAERDRLRDIVRQLVRVAIRDRETLRDIYSGVEYATEDDDAIGDALREARAALGAGETPTGKGVGR